MNKDNRHQHAISSQRWRLLREISALTERPLIVLAFVWVILLIIDLTSGLNRALVVVTYLIWLLFVADFVVKVIIAPHKLRYLRRNWLTVISLALPVLRVFAIFRTLRLLRAARAIRSVNLLRLLTSLNRGLRAIRATLGRRGLGFVVAFTLIVLFTGAAGMAAFESPAALRAGGYSTAETGLNSYGEAVWWTAMLLTTAGSDYWPRTPEGRLLAWLLALYAFAIFGYITAAIATIFLGRDTADKRANSERANRAAAHEAAALRAEIAALRAQLNGLSAQPPARGPSETSSQNTSATGE